jgi:hypothetical protein
VQLIKNKPSEPPLAASASGSAFSNSLPYLSAMQPTAKTALTLLFCFKSFAAKSVSIESFFAASINPQVLTNTASASLGS